MAFDTWSLWGVRKNNKDILYVNINEHNVSQLGNKFAHFIVNEFLKDNFKELNETAEKNINPELCTIVKPETLIDKESRKFIKKLLVNKKLNIPESQMINYWGAFFAQESYNPNFLLTNMKYRIDFTNYLKLSDITCCAYIFNLDTMKFEIYFGFNESKGVGRYGRVKHPTIESNFYGVNLITEIDIQDLINLHNNQFEKHNNHQWNLNYYVADNQRLIF